MEQNSSINHKTNTSTNNQSTSGIPRYSHRYHFPNHSNTTIQYRKMQYPEGGSTTETKTLTQKTQVTPVSNTFSPSNLSSSPRSPIVTSLSIVKKQQYHNDSNLNYNYENQGQNQNTLAKLLMFDSGEFGSKDNVSSGTAIGAQYGINTYNNLQPKNSSGPTSDKHLNGGIQNSSNYSGPYQSLMNNQDKKQRANIDMDNVKHADSRYVTQKQQNFEQPNTYSHNFNNFSNNYPYKQVVSNTNSNNTSANKIKDNGYYDNQYGYKYGQKEYYGGQYSSNGNQIDTNAYYDYKYKHSINRDNSSNRDSSSNGNSRKIIGRNNSKGEQSLQNLAPYSYPQQKPYQSNRQQLQLSNSSSEDHRRPMYNRDFNQIQGAKPCQLALDRLSSSHSRSYSQTQSEDHLYNFICLLTKKIEGIQIMKAFKLISQQSRQRVKPEDKYSSASYQGGYFNNIYANSQIYYNDQLKAKKDQELNYGKQSFNKSNSGIQYQFAVPKDINQTPQPSLTNLNQNIVGKKQQATADANKWVQNYGLSSISSIQQQQNNAHNLSNSYNVSTYNYNNYEVPKRKHILAIQENNINENSGVRLTNTTKDFYMQTFPSSQEPTNNSYQMAKTHNGGLQMPTFKTIYEQEQESNANTNSNINPNSHIQFNFTNNGGNSQNITVRAKRNRSSKKQSQANSTSNTINFNNNINNHNDNPTYATPIQNNYNYNQTKNNNYNSNYGNNLINKMDSYHIMERSPSSENSPNNYNKLNDGDNIISYNNKLNQNSPAPAATNVIGNINSIRQFNSSQNSITTSMSKPKNKPQSRQANNSNNKQAITSIAQVKSIVLLKQTISGQTAKLKPDKIIQLMYTSNPTASSMYNRKEGSTANNTYKEATGLCQPLPSEELLHTLPDKQDYHVSMVLGNTQFSTNNQQIVYMLKENPDDQLQLSRGHNNQYYYNKQQQNSQQQQQEQQQQYHNQDPQRHQNIIQEMDQDENLRIQSNTKPVVRSFGADSKNGNEVGGVAPTEEKNPNNRQEGIVYINVGQPLNVEKINLNNQQTQNQIAMQQHFQQIQLQNNIKNNQNQNMQNVGNLQSTQQKQNISPKIQSLKQIKPNSPQQIQQQLQQQGQQQYLQVQQAQRPQIQSSFSPQSQAQQVNAQQKINPLPQRPTTSYSPNLPAPQIIQAKIYPRNVSPQRSNSPILLQRPVSYSPGSVPIPIISNVNQIAPTVKINVNGNQIKQISRPNSNRPGSNLSPNNIFPKVQFVNLSPPSFIKPSLVNVSSEKNLGKPSILLNTALPVIVPQPQTAIRIPPNSSPQKATRVMSEKNSPPRVFIQNKQIVQGGAMASNRNFLIPSHNISPGISAQNNTIRILPRPVSQPNLRPLSALGAGINAKDSPSSSFGNVAASGQKIIQVREDYYTGHSGNLPIGAYKGLNQPRNVVQQVKSTPNLVTVSFGANSPTHFSNNTTSLRAQPDTNTSNKNINVNSPYLQTPQAHQHRTYLSIQSQNKPIQNQQGQIRGNLPVTGGKELIQKPGMIASMKQKVKSIVRPTYGSPANVSNQKQSITEPYNPRKFTQNHYVRDTESGVRTDHSFIRQLQNYQQKSTITKKANQNNRNPNPNGVNPKVEVVNISNLNKKPIQNRNKAISYVDKHTEARKQRPFMQNSHYIQNQSFSTKQISQYNTSVNPSPFNRSNIPSNSLSPNQVKPPFNFPVAHSPKNIIASQQPHQSPRAHVASYFATNSSNSDGTNNTNIINTSNPLYRQYYDPEYSNTTSKINTSEGPNKSNRPTSKKKLTLVSRQQAYSSSNAYQQGGNSQSLSSSPYLNNMAFNRAQSPTANSVNDPKMPNSSKDMRNNQRQSAYRGV